MLNTSFVAPIHKVGSNGDAANYNLVSLISHIVKVFEKIVKNKLVNYLEENHLLDDSQHGFRSGRSQSQSTFLTYYDTIVD